LPRTRREPVFAAPLFAFQTGKPMRRLVVSIVACLFAAFTGHAALFDAFLKIEGVEGESTDSKHLNWIEVQSFAHGNTSPAPATGKPGFSDCCLTKYTDKSSPVLEQNCAQGKHFRSANLELVTADANRVRFYQIVLSNVVVSSVSASGTTGASTKPLESLCLTYSQISWTYTELDASGVPAGDFKAWWDLALGLGNSNVNPVLRVSGAQLDSTTLRLSWPAKAGKTYNILASPIVTGTYQIIQTVPSPSDGPISLSLPVTGSANFFRVQEPP